MDEAQAGWQGIVKAYQHELQVDIVRAGYVDAFDVLGVDRRPKLKRIINPLFLPVGPRFPNFLAEFEYKTEKYGFQKAIRQQLRRFVKSVQSHNEGRLPPSDPLLLASNHPVPQ